MHGLCSVVAMVMLYSRSLQSRDGWHNFHAGGPAYPSGYAVMLCHVRLSC
jgi:hypothetical protein